MHTIILVLKCEKIFKKHVFDDNFYIWKRWILIFSKSTFFFNRNLQRLKYFALHSPFKRYKCLKYTRTCCFPFNDVISKTTQVSLPIQLFRRINHVPPKSSTRVQNNEKVKFTLPNKCHCDCDEWVRGKRRNSVNSTRNLMHRLRKHRYF